MSQKTTVTPPAKEEKGAMPVILQRIWNIFERISLPFLEAFFPKPHYLEGEEIKQVIRMAHYRAQIPKLLGILGTIILVSGLIALGVITLARSDTMTSARSDTGQMIAAIAVIIGLFLVFESAQHWLLYNQWQCIVTNKRFILITPHPQRHGFADVIYLKGGKIQVLDTNFSKNPVWGLFQAILGTRDVMLSMSGYEFLETGAQVKGGLRFPDVRPDDIRRLEELIFG